MARSTNFGKIYHGVRLRGGYAAAARPQRAATVQRGSPGTGRNCPSCGRYERRARPVLLPLPSALGVPLAEADAAPERRWNPWDIAVFPVVDTAGVGP